MAKNQSKSLHFDKEMAYLILFLIIIGSLFLCNKLDVFMSAESDGYFHALGGLFIYDSARWWIENPTFSIEAIKIFVVEYETQFKFFGGIGYYQPFHSLFVSILVFFSGKHPITFYLATIIETIGAMFYAYRIYKLIYGEKREFLYLTLLLIAFNPAVFNFAASYSLEPGIMLFSTMTIFYFIRFMREEKTRDLYLTSISFGLGMLTKTPFVIVFPVLLAAAILEGKVKIFFKKPKPLIKSLIIFIIILSPWLVMEYVFSGLGISKIGERIAAAAINLDVPIMDRLNYLNITLFYIFGLYLLIPFLIYGFFKSKRKEGPITMLIFIIFYSFFYNIIPNVQSRYLTAVVPFAIILSVSGIELFYQKYKSSRIVVPFVVLMVFASILVSFNYTTVEKKLYSSTDVLQPAIYISDNSYNKTTVMSTFSRMQSVPFVMIDDENVNIIRAPNSWEGGTEELKIMLDSNDYVKRPHKPEWKNFGLIHPPVEWVVVHERYDGLEPDYLLKEIIEKRNDFELVKTIEGSWPGNRVFIYRRKPEFFY